MRQNLLAGLCALGVLLVGGAVLATTYKTITVDGNLADFSADESFPADGLSDSLYGVNNELNKVHATWNKNTLYLGFDYAAINTAVMVLLDTGKSGGVSDLCPTTMGGSYKGDYPANVQGPTWDLMVAMWVPKDGLSAPVVTVHTLASNSSVKLGLATAGLSIGQKESFQTGTNPGWKGQVEVGLSWNLIWGLGAGKVPAGAKIKVVGVLRGSDNGDGLGDVVPNPSGALNKGKCGGGSGNTLDRFFDFTVDCDGDGVADSGRKPNVVTCPSTPKPDAGVPDAKPAPDQAPAPDLKPATDSVAWPPDQGQTQKDAAPKPDSKPAPDQAVAQKDKGTQQDKGSTKQDQGATQQDLGWADVGSGLGDSGSGEGKKGPRQDEGCACSAQGNTDPSLGLMLIGLLGLVLVNRRRRG